MTDSAKLQDEDIQSDAFFAEAHMADAMPSAHWHDHIEINYLPDGHMHYLINGRRVALLPRRLGVFWAAIPHQAIEVEEFQTLYCLYVPIVEFLSLPIKADFRSALLNGQLVQTAQECADDLLIFQRLSREWTHCPPLLRQVYQEEVLLRLRRMSLEPTEIQNTGQIVGMTPHSSRANPKLVRHVERITAFINENVGSAIKVSDVVAASGLHHTNAMSAFRNVLGISIGQYIRRHRLSQAMRLLAESDREIAEIAHATGYRSLSRLYDAFHEQIGKTPSRFRREFKEPLPAER